MSKRVAEASGYLLCERARNWDHLFDCWRRYHNSSKIDLVRAKAMLSHGHQASQLSLGWFSLMMLFLQSSIFKWKSPLTVTKERWWENGWSGIWRCACNMKVNALKRGYKSAASFSVLSSLSSESSHSFLSPLLSHCTAINIYYILIKIKNIPSKCSQLLSSHFDKLFYQIRE